MASLAEKRKAEEFEAELNRQKELASMRRKVAAFQQLYGFMLTSARVMSRSSDPDEAHVGESMVKALQDNHDGLYAKAVGL